STKELAVLENLAAIIMQQLELRLSSLDALRIEQRLREAAEHDRDEARRGLDTAELDRDEAHRDRDTAELARDEAQRDRDTAELDRDEAHRDRDQARVDRDDAVRDRGIAERDRDLIQEYATVLQRTLLPPSLPDIDGVAIAS